mmetsp:Transcript_64468/g.114677  ORF Transcript_64468/g.114677 Transcript_64468/m.114677 type:complete len:202 (+) Transcript_64468:69-674(+)
MSIVTVAISSILVAASAWKNEDFGEAAVFLQLGSKLQLDVITKSNKCTGNLMSGVYMDVKDNDKKILNVSSQYDVTITPPAPDSIYCEESVGTGWAVKPSDGKGVSYDCKIEDINFNVANKPDPPDSLVTAWVFNSKIADINFLNDCISGAKDSESCGVAASWAVEHQAIFKDEKLFVVGFGDGGSDFGNVWVKISGLDGP